MYKQLVLPFYNTFTKNTTKVENKIFDSINTSNIGILYWTQEALEQITELSGPLAKTNEFQIHYWALVTRINFTDLSTIDIAFPTAIFNYKQEVSSAHIDFELKDVNEMSKALEPVHHMVTNKLKTQIKYIFDKYDNSYVNSIEFISVPMNTLHRHPTGVSSFSSTDLNKNHTYNTGIVFPLASANKTPSFSSIIYNNPVQLIHTEYRVATGNVNEEVGINYQKGRCISYIKNSITHPSKAEEVFGICKKDTSYIITTDKNLDIKFVETFLSTVHYEINTQFVKEDNVEKKTYSIASKTEKIIDFTNNVLVTTYEKKLVKEIKDVLKLDIYDLSKLEKMKDNILKLHCLKLEQYYYSDNTLNLSAYHKLGKNEIIEAIMELQDNIITEYEKDDLQEELEDNYWYLNQNSTTDTISLKDKKEMLEACGVRKQDLDAVSPYIIDKWYEEITN